MPPKGSKKKKNFSYGEIEALLNEVSLRKEILFSSVSSGVKGSEKRKAWQDITSAINAVCAEERTLGEIKKKWFDLKMDAKKRLSAAARRTVTAAGGGQEVVRTTDTDERIGAIIGKVAPSRVKSEIPPYTDLPRPGNSLSGSDSIPQDQPCEDNDASGSSAPSTSRSIPGPSQNEIRPSRRSTRADIISESVLQNQQKILETLQHMLSQFSQMNETLKEINHTLKNI